MAALLMLVGLQACGTRGDPSRAGSPEELRDTLAAVAQASGAEVGLYYRDLQGGDSLLLSPDVRMHAASTMKVPVMMRLFLDDDEGVRSLDEPLEVTTVFRSIVDGSPFELDPGTDSDSTLYARVGESVSARELIGLMITRSSNLATNILIQTADAGRVTALLRELGADSMEVLRGVEDLKAFERGLSNTTTARDLGVVMATVAEGPRFSEESREEMLTILERQHFRANIPAGIPPGVHVANKTGWITGINHDAAVVFPPEDPPYVLVILIRGHPGEDQGESLAAELSRIVWEYHTRVP
ncbi:MAG: class A beta-lactamase-related serine hydrolase [Gemmatimonadota bacterium]|nr:class A beta-lactamase-related serine hydrolase [Gemmatimonadota bacterium]